MKLSKFQFHFKENNYECAYIGTFRRFVGEEPRSSAITVILFNREIMKRNRAAITADMHELVRNSHI